MSHRRKRHWGGAGLRIGRAAALLVPAFLSSGGSAQIVIHEIEYDHVGNDIREFIELYEPGQTGMSLEGWRLVLYFGAFGTPYRTIDLSEAPGGVMPADGYLVLGSAPLVPEVDIHVPGQLPGSAWWIRNDPPNGMALVRDTGDGDEVIELLAYEGSFTADAGSNGGPAAGMFFPDIGVWDDAGTCAGLHLHLETGAWVNIPEPLASPGRGCGLDLGDFAEFLDCMLGPTPASDACRTKDWNCGGFVDLRDFWIFQRRFPDPPCP